MSSSGTEKVWPTAAPIFLQEATPVVPAVRPGRGAASCAWSMFSTLLAATVIVAGLSGCVGPNRYEGGSDTELQDDMSRPEIEVVEKEYDRPADDSSDPAPAQTPRNLIDVSREQHSRDAGVSQPPEWSCAYDPTYDQDWHNDVLCSDGVSFDRPYLREWDDFVTEQEIMDSAAEYENALNAR